MKSEARHVLRESADAASWPVPSQEAPAGDATNEPRSILDRILGRRARRRRFLAVTIQRDNLALFLECVYTARLLKRRHDNIDTAIILHPDNLALAEHTGVFDLILTEESAPGLRARIAKHAPDVLYLPDRTLRAQMSTLFTGARIKIGGSRMRLLSGLFGTHRIHQASDLAKLKRKGFDLFPEIMALRLGDDYNVTDIDLPGRPFVWVSLFDDHDVTSAWPPGHVGRLARLLAEAGLDMVIPVPPLPSAEFETSATLRLQGRIKKEVEYLRKSATNLHVIENCFPARRAFGMLRAEAVVSPAGPETILASLFRRPVVVLHDMKTYLNHPGHVRPPNPRKDGAARDNSLVLPVGTMELLKPDYPLTSYIIKLANAYEKHIRPTVDECSTSCPTCSFSSCVEYISPERVFESLKRTIFPC